MRFPPRIGEGTKSGAPLEFYRRLVVLDERDPEESLVERRTCPLKGKRDRAMFAVLGCGLRGRELADLEFTHLQQREEHWAIVDLVEGRVLNPAWWLRDVP